MAEKEALDARELGEALNVSDDAKPLTINDLPNDQLVSIFMAIDDQLMVRHTIPLVCKAWADLYRTEDASPLHETLELNLWEETKTAMAGRRWEWDSEEEEDMEEWWGNEEPWDDRGPPVHASRVISWAERRAGSVHHLRLTAFTGRDLRDFHSKDLGALVAVVGASLTEIRIDAGPNILRHYSFWEAMRDSVLPAGRLRSFVVRGKFPDDSFGPNLEALDLGQLAGSLEELVMEISYDFVAESFYELQLGLPRFPESVCALTALRRLVAIGRFSKIPAKISSLKKLEELKLGNSLSSLPKELGKLSRLEKLDLSGNNDLGEEPEDEAFPAALGEMKSLRELDLSYCGLRAVPTFVGELKSLEILDLANCSLSSLHQGLGELSRLTRLNLGDNELGNALHAGEAFPAALGEMKSLRELDLSYCGLRAVPTFVGELKSLEILDLASCSLSSLHQGLGELSRLTRLNLSYNDELGNALHAGEAFPAALGKMKSLRELDLSYCGLRAVPTFVGELKSLEILDLANCSLSSLHQGLGELSRLTRLNLRTNHELGNALHAGEAFPAALGKMKSLRELDLSNCSLSSLHQGLGELSRLTRLNLRYNNELGNALHAGEAFPAALGKMKSLRELDLSECGLRAVPTFVGELKSLEVLNIEYNRVRVDAPFDFVIEGCPRLRKVKLKCALDNGWPRLKTIKAKLLAQNPNAEVIY